MKTVISIVLILISIGIFGVRISKSIELKQNVSGYLKRAADANTIELANQELTRTINYLESKNITKGYTSVFWRTPDEDVDFWYRNLKASQKVLQELNSENEIEKTNVLMKLRETLLDTGDKIKVTIPKGLSVFPNNKMWAFLTFIGLTSGFIGIMILLVAAESKSKKS